MQKKGELSRLAVNLLIGSLIIIVFVILAFFIFKNINDIQKGNVLVKDLDLKISQVKKVDDKNMEITVQRNEGEGQFNSLSFIVDDGSNVEVIKKETSMGEGTSETFSLNFILINASRVKRISITPIFIKGNGEEIVGEVEDEYVTPNTCSNYCPVGAQCGYNDCGMLCGNGCASGYLCLSYKCIKEKTSSGGGSSGGSSSSGDDEDNQENETVCNPSCTGKNCGGDGCGGSCGACSSGYTCAVNGTCMKEVVIDCGEVICKSGEYCFNGVCLLNVTGNTYFVSTTGSDSNPGTFTEPFYSWQKAVEVSQPGDITYIRGGIWMPTTHILTSGGYDTGAIAMTIDPTAQNFGRSGTANAPIRYYNYPGEKPIMDGGLLSPNQDRWQGGIGISYAEHIYFKGLTIRNIFQSLPDFNHLKVFSEVYGINAADSANLRFENVTVYNVNGRGFQHWSGAWNEGDGPGAFFEYDNTSWINCDAYNLYDIYSDSPGNAADGWYLVGYYGNYYLYDGCRAWNYSDDGFNTNGAGYTRFENCWAMSTNFAQKRFDDGLVLPWYPEDEAWDPEGNGFKTTGVNVLGMDNYELFKENFVTMKNCIVADCSGAGFVLNLEIDYETDWPSNALVYNNFGYKSAANFWDSNINENVRTSYYRNNIAYKSTDTSGAGYGLPDPLYEVGIYNPSVYNESHNTWRSTPEESWPGWEYNPDYVVTDADFLSLDYSQLMRPRKADGSLPDITFGHLAQGSDLIDGGVVIPGYHCLTSGAHPGQDCREWYGSAPDLGPFESNY